ncbi:transcription termination/antitermination protein NusG [Pontiella sulfatireligans]|uniref:Transcription termination/antitermination protein NusG n=1 Tax=Pontiella sulfatireligans TaxID=2750658 RepID=A0A6C2UK06_9BACT|nr:transcription termination/antitermination protein NusG [Pontiella sulfatireligans]VGO20562.1 Transcription termination/antitermination protein NusG [Pontiella sulfatireligans]
MPKQWFILHALSGHELKVQKNIASRVQQEEMEDVIGEVLIPAEKVSEVKQGKKTTVNRKFFPGYILIHINLFDDGALNERAWYFIQNTPSVIGFLGGDKPAPLSDKEVSSIVNQLEEKKETVAPKVMFEPGETVKVTDGPFMNFSGVIEEVDPERGKLKISVSIFGRTAPVELEYWQVERSAE